MGCCVSSNKALTSSVAVAQPPKTLESNGASFQVEQEKVKEVLSETPKWNPKTTTKSERRKPHQNMKAFHKFKEEESKAFSINKGNETSEICSLSKATTITYQREDGEETGKRVNRSPAKLQKNRSFSGDVGGRRERKVHGPRNFGSVRLIQCRDQVGQKMVDGGMRRRRDPGENSFRRSRSPATRADTGEARSILGRSPSAGITNRPRVAKARTAPPEKGRRNIKIPATDSKRPSASESLENPLVSLECFIFI